MTELGVALQALGLVLPSQGILNLDPVEDIQITIGQDLMRGAEHVGSNGRTKEIPCSSVPFIELLRFLMSTASG